jgi:RHS repeat-associated protein
VLRTIRTGFTYTGAWQIAQEQSWHPWLSSGQWSVQQQYYGLRGVDDVVYRRADGGRRVPGQSDDGDVDFCFGNDLPLVGVSSPPGSSTDGGYYQLTDSQFSVVAHVDGGTGRIVHRYSYNAYGVMKTHPITDLDGDGHGGFSSDDLALSNAIAAGDPAGDFNGDGSTDNLDQSDYDAAKEQLSPPANSPACGVLGWGDVAEPRIGYCGYVKGEWTALLSANSSAATLGNNWWLARHRWLEPAAGRWINRDPAGYADGLSMYLYVRGNPLGSTDPMGLESTWLGNLLRSSWNPLDHQVGDLLDDVIDAGRTITETLSGKAAEQENAFQNSIAKAQSGQTQLALKNGDAAGAVQAIQGGAGDLAAQAESVQETANAHGRLTAGVIGGGAAILTAGLAAPLVASGGTMTVLDGAMVGGVSAMAGETARQGTEFETANRIHWDTLSIKSAGVMGAGTGAAGETVSNSLESLASGSSRVAATGKTSTFSPGPYARNAIPARDASRNFTTEERELINTEGRDAGCHTCGTKEPGTKSGNFVPDHQPVSALNSNNAKQKLYPHCINCSRKQGLDTANFLKEHENDR